MTSVGDVGVGWIIASAFIILILVAIGYELMHYMKKKMALVSEELDTSAPFPTANQTPERVNHMGNDTQIIGHAPDHQAMHLDTGAIVNAAYAYPRGDQAMYLNTGAIVNAADNANAGRASPLRTENDGLEPPPSYTEAINHGNRIQ
jgi:hypothetical protein